MKEDENPTARRRPARPSKERILSTAARLFARKGYAATSVDEVAAAAKTSKSSIYWHFKSKEDILLALLTQSTSAWVSQALDVVAAIERPEEKLPAVLRNAERQMTGSRDTLRLLIGMICERGEVHPRTRAALQAIYREFREVIARELKAAFPYLTPDLVRLASVLILAAFDGMFIQWQLEPEAVDPKKVFAQIESALDPVVRLATVPNRPA
ncbi:MAG: TetR/AcrR family transcriptional regulator [Bdellovibrionota bacterium]